MVSSSKVELLLKNQMNLCLLVYIRQVYHSHLINFLKRSIYHMLSVSVVDPYVRHLLGSLHKFYETFERNNKINYRL